MGSWRQKHERAVRFGSGAYVNEINLVILGRVPSKKNSKRRIKRGGSVFMVPSEAHEAWHEAASYQIAGHRPEKPLGRCSVEITIYAADRRHFDLSNATESLMDLIGGHRRPAG